MKATLKRVLLPLICSAFVVVLDQITKNIVSGYGVSLNDTYIIPHLLQYNYLHNTGAGMGTLSGGGWFLIPVTAIAIVLGIVAIFSKWGKESLLFTWSLALVIGGGIGNLIDRIFVGYVTDFMLFPVSWFPFSFNVADVAVSVGGAMLILYLLIDTVKAKKEEKEKKTSPQNEVQDGE